MKTTETEMIGITPEDKEYADGFAKGFTENFARTYKESMDKIKTLDMPENKRQAILASMEEKYEERLRESLRESLIKAVARRKFEGKQ